MNLEMMKRLAEAVENWDPVKADSEVPGARYKTDGRGSVALIYWRGAYMHYFRLLLCKNDDRPFFQAFRVCPAEWDPLEMTPYLTAEAERAYAAFGEEEAELKRLGFDSFNAGTYFTLDLGTQPVAGSLSYSIYQISSPELHVSRYNAGRRGGWNGLQISTPRDTSYCRYDISKGVLPPILDYVRGIMDKRLLERLFPRFNVELREKLVESPPYGTEFWENPLPD